MVVFIDEDNSFIDEWIVKIQKLSSKEKSTFFGFRGKSGDDGADADADADANLRLEGSNFLFRKSNKMAVIVLYVMLPDIALKYS